MIKYMQKIDCIARKDTFLVLKFNNDAMEIDNFDSTDIVLIFIILEDINWGIMLVSFCTTYSIPNICNIVIKYTWKSIVTYTVLVQLLNIFIDCVVIIVEFNNVNHTSYYQFIFSDCLSCIDSTMMYFSIKTSQSTESIIYIVFELIKQHFNNFKDNFDVYRQQNGNMHCGTIDFILMGIMIIICIIYGVFLLMSYVEFQHMTLLYHFIQIVIILIVCSMILYDYNNLSMEFYSYLTYCIVFFIVVLYMIDTCQLELVSFVVALYIVIDTIYIYVESILISNITIFIQLLNIFINCIVIIDGDCRSYYDFVNCYFVSFTHPLMVYLTITPSETIFYDTNQ